MFSRAVARAPRGWRRGRREEREAWAGWQTHRKNVQNIFKIFSKMIWAGGHRKYIRKKTEKIFLTKTPLQRKIYIAALGIKRIRKRDFSGWDRNLCVWKLSKKNTTCHPKDICWIPSYQRSKRWSQGGNKRSDWNCRSTLTQVSSCALYFLCFCPGEFLSDPGPIIVYTCQ